MHGMFGSLSNLSNLAQAFLLYRVIGVDLRNHGDSPHEQQMDIEVMAGDIVELLDALDIKSATLVGHSLGGKVGMGVLNQPDRVACLVVADISQWIILSKIITVRAPGSYQTDISLPTAG